MTVFSVKRIGLALFAALTTLGVFEVVRTLMYARTFDESAESLIAKTAYVRELAKPGYQAEVLARLAPNPHNGAYYRLEDRLDASVPIREPEPEPGDAEAGVIFGLEFENEEAGLVAGDRVSTVVRDGLLRVTSERHEHLTNSMPVRIPKDEVGSLTLRLRTDESTQLSVAWSKNEDDDEGADWVNIDLIPDGQFHTYEVNATNALKRGLAPGDTIRRLFVRPANFGPATLEFDFIRFVSKKADYFGGPRGVGYETVDAEMRRVLYMLAPQTLQVELGVPDARPRLDFGTAVLLDDRPMTFRVSIAPASASEDRPSVVYEQTVNRAEAWSDVQLDLSPWSGQSVRLLLEVDGSRENVAYWSNPVVWSTPASRFNVIWIVEDALRADHLSTYGYGRATSPVKDSLMTESGVIFLNAYSQATATRPSVPSYMTSLLPTATSVWAWGDMLSEEYLTLAEVMRAQGYATASFLQNGNAGPFAGLHQGFSFLRDGQSVGDGTASVLGEHLRDWIQRHHERNFFLYVHIIDPHGPYNPPLPFDSWYHEASGGVTPVERTDLDPEWVADPTLEGRNLLYDGEIRHNDLRLGELLEELSRLSILDSTLLIYTTDHGEYLGEHGRWKHGPPGLLPVIHVPLMFHFPGRFSERQEVAEVVQLIDVMPTILEMAGISIDHMALHGTSLVSLLDGDSTSFWKNRVAVSEEPLTMRKGTTCPCGSVFFRGWQLLASRSLHGLSRRHRRAFRYSGHHGEHSPTLSIPANYLLMQKYGRVLPALQANNREAWQRWTGKASERVIVDPDVAKRLRALGYINN